MNNAFEPLTSETDNAYRDPGRTLVSRLIGMETEYATMIVNRPELASDQLPSARAIYERLTAAIRSDQPTVSGIYDRDQIFLASGGAVTFESHPTLQTLPGGLIEIATPEVNSPDELLACQRSVDQLVSESAIDDSDDVDLRILKNSSDALGHVYGCQENFEAEVASGVWLWIYWCFVTLLWGMQLVSLVVTFPMFTLVHLFGMWRHNRRTREWRCRIGRAVGLLRVASALVKVLVTPIAATGVPADGDHSTHRSRDTWRSANNAGI